jgi:hypothetical protein
VVAMAGGLAAARPRSAAMHYRAEDNVLACAVEHGDDRVRHEPFLLKHLLPQLDESTSPRVYPSRATRYATRINAQAGFASVDGDAITRFPLGARQFEHLRAATGHRVKS